ncbi:MAG: ABC transporter permease [Deltaproteobacteria bacterium]|nr:ABC transporter permease [Deltaproteobacteria bacterium]
MAGFERFVGLRFLRPRRKQVFLSIITVISIAGVSVGVATLIVVISVLSGMQDYVQTKSMEAYSHMIILSFGGLVEDYGKLVERVEGYPGVVAASPFVYNEVMMTFKDNATAVVLRGVDVDSFKRVSNLESKMEIGRLEDLTQTHKPASPENVDEQAAPDMPGIVIGSELAATLHVFPGDVIGVVNPLGEETPMGLMPKLRRYVVTGLFTLGLYEFDSKFAFISKAEAQDFTKIGDRVTGVEVRLEDIWKAPELALQMNNDIGWPFKVKDWTKMNENLFAALKLEKLAMFLILSLIMFVASLNIFSTLYMVVKDKRRSIAGAADDGRERVFGAEDFSRRRGLHRRARRGARPRAGAGPVSRADQIRPGAHRSQGLSGRHAADENAARRFSDRQRRGAGDDAARHLDSRVDGGAGRSREGAAV